MSGSGTGRARDALRQKVLMGCCGLLASTTLLSAGAATVALANGGEARIAGLVVWRSAVGASLAAERLLRSPEPPMARNRQVEALTRKALSMAPTRTGDWLRLAYLDVLRNNRMTPAGVDALARSYDLTALDQTYALWRICFALDHWVDLPEPLQGAVKNEAFVMARSPQHTALTRKALSGLQTPTGRLVAAFWSQDPIWSQPLPE
jgi:hypothetical protein